MKFSPRKLRSDAPINGCYEAECAHRASKKGATSGRDLELGRVLGRKDGGEDKEADRLIESAAWQPAGPPEVGGESKALGVYL